MHACKCIQPPQRTSRNGARGNRIKQPQSHTPPPHVIFRSSRRGGGRRYLMMQHALTRRRRLGHAHPAIWRSVRLAGRRLVLAAHLQDCNWRIDGRPRPAARHQLLARTPAVRYTWPRQLRSRGYRGSARSATITWFAGTHRGWTRQPAMARLTLTS